MKNFLFGLMATMFFSAAASAQTMSETAKKAATNAQMVTMVNVSKAFYVRGQTYNDFVKAMAIPSPTVPSQDEFFRKVYTYVSAGTADCDIAKADNSVLTRFATDLSKSPKNLGTPTSVYSAKKKWWQIAINALFNVVIDIIHPANDMVVDLFPETLGEAIQQN